LLHADKAAPYSPKCVEVEFCELRLEGFSKVRIQHLA
jgi:hypothetical protein